MNALVAGFGNVFFSDDGFGPRAVALYAAQPPEPGIRARDFGISGMHLALEMLEPYDAIVLVDAIAREDAPGTLFAIEPEPYDSPVAPDAHAMDVRSVLSLYERLKRDLEPSRNPKIVLVGCVPENTGEGMTLSAAVEAALPASMELIREILTRYGNPSGETISSGAKT